MDAIRIFARDTVAVALRDIRAGERIAVGDETVEAGAAIASGHKIALRPVRAGDPVIRYGWPIGAARCAIAAGEPVHTHNLATRLRPDGVLVHEPDRSAIAPGSRPLAAAFDGYRRSRGGIGVRNEIWVIATVGCVARTAQRIAAEAARRHGREVDGVHAITHPLGCSQLGDDLSATQAILAALADHPNAGGVLIVGLGCESNQVNALLAATLNLDPARVRALTAQAVGDELETGLALVAELAAVARDDVRTPCPVSALKIGVKCGGSDGFSGLTANPLVGRVTDTVTAAGGVSILTEIPEIFGAEHVLLNRAVSDGVFDAGAALVARFKRYFTDHDQPVSENPSPGNIAGGITTLEEKSLGAVQKAGQAALTDVIPYGGRAVKPGLTLLEAPGNDAVSSTALAAAGAHVILFTTGRGTPLGFPVPTVKIASNSSLAQHKAHWIDFDAGPVLTGEPMGAAADRLFGQVLAVASGAPTRSELNDEREIAHWKQGVTL